MTDDPRAPLGDGGHNLGSEWTESDIEKFREARLAYEKSRNIRIASMLELLLIMMVIFLYVYFEIYFMTNDIGSIVPMAALLQVLNSIPAVTMFTALIVNIFQTILTGRAILVSVLVAISEIDFRKILSELAGAMSATTDIGMAATLPGLMKGAYQKELRGDGSLATGEQSASLKATDHIERVFERHIARSQKMVESAQRRPNALLFVGVIVAGAGLSVFIFTIPGLFAQIDAGPKQTSDAIASMMDLLPKLLMLLFVQVLAGFFLRQYRVSMVELRYYESVLRYRESQYVSYLVRTKNGTDKNTLQAIGRELLVVRDFLNLRPGETNMFLETSKLEENEFKGLYERIMDVIDKRVAPAPTKLAPEKKPSRPRSPKPSG